MTDTILTAIIVATPSTLTALAAFLQSLRNGNRLSRVVKEMDGMKDALVAGAHREGVTAGVIQEHQDETKRQTQKL